MNNVIDIRPVLLERYKKRMGLDNLIILYPTITFNQRDLSPTTSQDFLDRSLDAVVIEGYWGKT